MPSVCQALDLIPSTAEFRNCQLEIQQSCPGWLEVALCLGILSTCLPPTQGRRTTLAEGYMQGGSYHSQTWQPQKAQSIHTGCRSTGQKGHRWCGGGLSLRSGQELVPNVPKGKLDEQDAPATPDMVIFS